MAAALSREVASKSDSDLRSSSRALVARATGLGSDEDARISEALALYIESSRRTIGVSYSRGQLLAAAAMCIGVAPELSRGANRSAGMAAYWYSLVGGGVHILLADDYLAQRDVLLLASVLGNLDRRIGILSEGMSDPERRHSYMADITIGSSTRLMDDFLREKLPGRGFESVQRNRHVAVVGDGSSVALGRSSTRRALLAPRTEFPPLARHPDRSGVERATARIQRDGGTDDHDEAVKFNRRGIRAIAEELHLPEFSPEFVVAAEEIRSQLQSSRTGGAQAGIPYVEIALFAYLRQYETLACTVWSAREDAPDLKRLYGLPCVQFPEVDAMVSPGLPVSLVAPERRLEALLRRVDGARRAGLPVMVRATRLADAEACAAALASRGIESVLVRPGHELEAFAQSKAGDAVTIVEPGVTMPESLDADAVTELAAARLTWRAGSTMRVVDPRDLVDVHGASRHVAVEAMSTAAGRTMYLAYGFDLSASFIDWQRVASVDDGESWILVFADDPLLEELGSEMMASLNRLPESLDNADPEGTRGTVGAELYRRARALVRYDRIGDWALRSSVEKQAELFYELRDFIATAPADDMVARLIEEYVAEIASQDGPEAIQRGVSAVVDGSKLTLAQHGDVQRRRLQARQYLTEVYEETQSQSDPPVLHPSIRDDMLWNIGGKWCRFLYVASFVRRHLEEAYPSGSSWVAEYERDMSSRFSRSIRDFRRETLRSILSTGI